MNAGNLFSLLAHEFQYARRGEFISKLFEGDPVAWSILGGVIAIYAVIHFVRASSAKRQAPPQDVKFKSGPEIKPPM